MCEWLGSPDDFNNDNANVFNVNNDNEANNNNNVNNSRGVRPVFSLSANLGYTGTGTTTDPFIVD